MVGENKSFEKFAASGQFSDLEEDVKWDIVSGASVDEFWKPEKGDVIDGKLSGSFDGQYGKVWLLEVSKRVIGLPSNVALNTLLLKVPNGERVRITYVDDIKSDKGRTYKSFKVEVARKNIGSMF